MEQKHEITTEIINVSTPELASRWSRLGASIIDSLIMAVFLGPLAYFSGGFDGLMQDPPVEAPISYQALMAVISFGLYCAINWTYLSKYGQTVGKRALEIKVVNVDNTEPSGKDLVIKRYVPYAFIPYIPFIGQFISFIGLILIFGKQKRCLHDIIAGTKVVNS